MSDVKDQTSPPEAFSLIAKSGAAKNRMSALAATLQRIDDRFARLLRAAFLQHLRRAVTVPRLASSASSTVN